MQRRDFLKTSTIATTAAVVGIDRAALAAKPVARPLIKKSLKYGMVTEKLSVLDKFKLLKDLEALKTAEIEAMLRAQAEIAEDATNAQRLRHARALVMLNEEMDKRFKAHEKSMERDAPGRSR